MIRAAFDVGSGATKMTVGQITAAGKLSVLFSDQQEILVGSNLRASSDGKIPQHIFNQLRNQLVEYKRVATDHGATKFACICTAAFREAKNGPEILSELESDLGFRFQLISQELEGKLGFQTAVAVSGLDPEDIISWDSGGSSFQIVAKKSDGFHVLEGPVGSSSCAQALAEIRGVTYTAESLNPVSLEEYNLLTERIQNVILEDKPIWLEEKLKSGCKVIGFGGETCLFRYPWYMDQVRHFGVEDIPSMVERTIDRSDHEISVPQPQFMIPKFALMNAVMKKYGLKDIFYHESNGNTEGMLLCSELWGRSTAESSCTIL